MTMDEFPKIIEVVPTLKGIKCKVLAYVIWAALSFSPLGMGIYIGYTYNIWIGIAFFLFLTLVSGIVSAKMRGNSIPYEQREIDYSTMAIIRWYLSQGACL